jgi:hypothetical protein
VIVDGDIGKQKMIFKVSSPKETPREPEMAAD